MHLLLGIFSHLRCFVIPAISTKGNDDDEVIEEDDAIFDNEERKLLNEFDTSATFSKENIGNNDEIHDNKNEEYESEGEYEEIEDNYETVEGNDNIENKSNYIMNEHDSLKDSSKYAEGMLYANEIEEDLERSNLEDISDSYEIGEDKNDLNLLTSKKDNTDSFNGKVLIFMIICLITICIALLVSVGIRLYSKYLKKKGENNRMVMDFKDREEIPVVQGIPAPWLNA